jgi:hypothetical protein
MIVSIFIVVFGVGALTQFSVAYCHTLLVAYGKVEISDRTQELTGIDIQKVDQMEFDRLMQFVRMSPDPRDDSVEIRIIQIYFRVMSLIRMVLAPLSKHISIWTDGELSKCAYFAAVTFDRRTPLLLNN